MMRYEQPPEGDHPPPLSPPASIQARNAEYNLDLIGRVTHLDERSIVASFPVEIPEGTVLFTHIDLRSINTVVRGLIRIRSQSEGIDFGGYFTIADFVDLNEDEKRKINRQLSGEIASRHGGTAEPHGDVPVAPGSTLPSKTRRPFRLPTLKLPNISIPSIIWFLLGIVFYSALALAVLAIFPQGRAWEFVWFAKLGHSVGPWYHRVFKI